jgi:spore maturation protein CgeB
MAGLYGKDFGVWGSDWWRAPRVKLAATVQGPAYASRFAEAVAEAPLQLGLLNSQNRDTHTCRSFEVPACGGVLIAPATAEHVQLLEDGVTAYLYIDEAELPSLIDRAISDRARTRRMSVTAVKSMRTPSNSYEHRAVEILKAVGFG